MTWINDKLVKFEKLLVSILLTLMVILGFMQIVSRFVIKSPISWSEGLLVYMFVWASYIGASIGVNEKKHFSVEIFVELLPKSIQKILSVMVDFLIIIFSLLIAYKGIILSIHNMGQIAPMLPFSMMWAYLCIPASSIFMVIHCINNIHNTVTGGDL